MSGNLYNLSNNSKLPVDFDAWKLFGNEKTEAIYISLAGGERINAHINPVNVLFIVISGNGIITYDSQTLNMNKGDCIYIEKENLREWENLSESKNLELMVIKYL